MTKQLSNKEIIDTITSLTNKLLEVAVDEPDELAVANNLLNAMVRNLHNEITAQETRLPAENSRSRPEVENVAEFVFTPRVIRPHEFTVEVRKILTHIEFKSPLYMICFENVTPNDITDFNGYLSQIILIAFYAILLNQEILESRETLDFFMQDEEALRVFKLIKGTRSNIFMEQLNTEEIRTLNAAILWLGRWTLKRKIMSTANYTEKFRLILDIIDLKEVQIRELGKLDLFSFIRLGIEATILCLNIYNKSIFIKKSATNNLKLKSIIINKMRKTNLDHPIIIYQDMNDVKFYLCVSGVQSNLQRHTTGLAEVSKRSGNEHSVAIGTTFNVTLKSSEGQDIIRTDGVSGLSFKRRSMTPVLSSQKANDTPGNPFNMTPGRQVTPRNLSFFNDQTSKIEIEINDSKFQSSDKKNLPLDTRESQHKYSQDELMHINEAKIGIKRANTETNEDEGEKNGMFIEANKLMTANPNQIDAKSSFEDGNMQGDFTKNQMRSRPASFIGHNTVTRVTYSNNHMSSSQPRTTETYVLTGDRPFEKQDDIALRTQNSDKMNIDTRSQNFSQRADQTENYVPFVNPNLGKQTGKFISSQSSLFTNLLDIIHKSDLNTSSLVKNLRQSGERIGKLQANGDNTDQITVKHGLMQPTIRYQAIEDPLNFPNRIQIGQNHRFVLSQNNLNMSDNSQRRNTEMKPGVQYTHVMSQPRMTSGFDTNNQPSPNLDFKTLITGAENEIRRRQTDALHTFKSNSVRREDPKSLLEQQHIPPSSEFINHNHSRN